MVKCLLIVESPAKAKTIAGYLNNRPEHWTVRATKGHVADLPRDRIGIQEDGGCFTGEWIVDADKKTLLQELKTLAHANDHVFIGADDDREGERIAHDVIVYLGLQHYSRITFREITPQAISEAIDGGIRGVRSDRVEAQMARRLVDREIGYPVSQIIRWHFAQTGRKPAPRGVGRVVSPSLSILAQTERDIAAFVPQPFERIACDYEIDGEPLRLMHERKFTPNEWQERDRILADLRAYPHLVYNFQKRNRDVPPYPPFTTARLQRCCFYLFGFDPKRTMRLAQDLYEGMETADGRHGLITYPRSDSLNLSDHAVAEIIALLSEHIPEDADEMRDMVLTVKRPFKSAPSAQGAHEAIRPSHFSSAFWPKNLAGHLSEDHRKVYELIWFRTLATQLKDAVYDASSVEIAAGEHRLRGQANFRIVEGWEYLDGHKAHVAERHDEERHQVREVRLPEVQIGVEVNLIESRALEMVTKCPPRFGIGRFLTVLDSKGIARPSTLDGIIDNLKNKAYAEVRAGFLYVTGSGLQVDEWTTDHAPWLSDADHARVFEELLDAVEGAEAESNLVIREYVGLIDALKETLGYQDKCATAPSDAQLTYAKELARNLGIAFPEDLSEDREWVKKFIDEHRPHRELVGKCPKCGKRTVFAHEKVFSCASIECDFKLFRNQLESFCRNFGVSQDPMEVAESLFARKETLFNALKTTKGKVFDAYIGIKQSPDQRWSIDIIRFARAKRPKPLAS